MFTSAQLSALVEIRHDLHRNPELSGMEKQTAARVLRELEALKPDRIASGLGLWQEADGRTLGGTGIAALFDSGCEGPTLLFRADMDALPIQEICDLPYKSATPLQAHLCGHDGHTTILLGLAMALAGRRPAKGKVVLLFQPAEENGKGARAVLDDPGFAPFLPDYAFALHNLPGLPLGHAWLKEGAMTCASRGFIARFEGKTSHASAPQDGVSPADALCEMMGALKGLSNGLNPDQGLDDAYKLVTITHARLGEESFGVAPGTGSVWATLRCVRDAAMDALVSAASEAAASIAARHELVLDLSDDDVFYACTNASETTQMVASALKAESIPCQPQPDPMRWSEDFGLISTHCPSTLFLLGSGEKKPQLHNPDFDFPDELISIGASVFERIVRDRLG